MNEKRIREVIEIEKQAEDLIAKASHDAEALPAAAAREARELLEKSRADAGVEAQRILEKVQAENEAAKIISEAHARMGDLGQRAEQNLEKAVAYVLERVIGKA